MGVSCFYHWSKLSIVDKLSFIIAVSLVQRNVFQSPSVFFRCLHKIAKSDYWLRHVCPSVHPSVCLHGKTSLPLDRFSWNFIFWDFFKIVHKIQVSLYCSRINGTVREDKYTFFTIFHSNLLRRKNVFDNICTENRNTHIMFSIFLFENHAVYRIMWKNTVEQGTTQMTKWHIHIACWIPKATNTHTGYVILIAFPLQWRLFECTSMLRYTYTAFLFLSKTSSGDLGSQTIFMQTRTYVCAKPVPVSTLKMSIHSANLSGFTCQQVQLAKLVLKAL